jgi:hypothetical protein
MRVGEACAAEVRHWIGFAPNDVVEDPVAEILQRGAAAKDVMVAADHPEGAVGLQDTARFLEPGAGESVILCEARKFVPIVIDRIDSAAFGTEQVAAELQIVGRIGEDHVDAAIGKRGHGGDAIILDDAAERQIERLLLGLPAHSRPHSPHRGHSQITPQIRSSR